VGVVRENTTGFVPEHPFSSLLRGNRGRMANFAVQDEPGFLLIGSHIENVRVRNKDRPAALGTAPVAIINLHRVRDEVPPQ
jgi:hypothetical protein